MRSVSPKINDERRPPGEVGHQRLSRRGSLGSSFHDRSVAQRRASGDPGPADGSGDAQGHGTWVASIVPAATNNGQGMAGVAPDAKILAIKAIGGDGTGSVDDISKSIRFAADRGASVINLSVGPDAFGKPFPTLDCPPVTVGGCLTPPVNDSGSLHKALQPAVDYASGRGALVVAAGSSNSAAASRIVSSADQVAAGARLDAAAALGVSSASLPLPARQPAAPPLRAAPAPVVAKPAQKATPAPAPTPTPTPTPSPTPTSEASPLAAAGLPSPRLASGATGRPASSTVSTQMVAFVL